MIFEESLKSLGLVVTLLTPMTTPSVVIEQMLQWSNHCLVELFKWSVAMLMNSPPIVELDAVRIRNTAVDFAFGLSGQRKKGCCHCLNPVAQICKPCRRLDGMVKLSFVRFAMAAWLQNRTCGGIIVTNYVSDFVTLCPQRN